MTVYSLEMLARQHQLQVERGADHDAAITDIADRYMVSPETVRRAIEMHQSEPANA